MGRPASARACHARRPHYREAVARGRWLGTPADRPFPAVIETGAEHPAISSYQPGPSARKPRRVARVSDPDPGRPGSSLRTLCDVRSGRTRVDLAVKSSSLPATRRRISPEMISKRSSWRRWMLVGSGPVTGLDHELDLEQLAVRLDDVLRIVPYCRSPAWRAAEWGCHPAARRTARRPYPEHTMVTEGFADPCYAPLLAGERQARRAAGRRRQCRVHGESRSTRTAVTTTAARPTEKRGLPVMPSVSFRYMTQPTQISRGALPASSLRAAQSWWACR